MTVQFFNKIYTTGSANIEIKPGIVLAETKNELLDSATILISQQTTPLTIEPFDIAILTDTGYGPRRFAIDTITERQVSVDPVIYEYQITLFSETKILENHVLPNLSITQPANPNERKTILFYIEKYLELYGPKKRIRAAAPNTTKWVWAPQFQLDPAITSVFGQIQCPEFQWNNPTLREVLTDLMMVNDKIPILRNNVIWFMDLTTSGSNITLTDTNFVEKVFTSTDSVSELRLNMENATSVKRENLDTVIKKVEYVGFRNASAAAFIDTDNMEVVVDNPISKLLRVTLMIPIHKPNYWSDFNWIEIDITNHCVEKGAYDLLSPEPKSLQAYQKDITDIGRKQFNVFYSRGGRTISGWGLKYNIGNFLFLTFNEYPYDSILSYVINTHDLPTQHHSINRMDTVFRVEYETSASVVMDIGRNYDIKFNKRTTFDNQSNAYVDVNAQGKFSQFKVNRLGNDVVTIHGRYNSITNVPNLGDKYNNDYIIFSREIAIFTDYVNVKMQAMKNYILRDYFTGVQSRKRNTELATESSFIRHDLKKFYAEFSLVPKFEQDSYNSNFKTQIVKSLFAFDSKDSVSQPIKLAAIKTFDPTSGEYPTNAAHYYAVEIDKKISGNSILLTLGAKDNVSVGDKIVLRTLQNIGSNIRTQERYPYANEDNGEFYNLRVLFYDNYDIADGINNWPSMGDYYLNANSNISTFLTEVRTRPLLTNLNTGANDLPLKYQLPVYKDNKEIMRLTNQIEFCSDSRSIIFTEQFLKLQKFVREQDFFETREYITVAKSAFPYISNLLGGSPEITYPSNLASYFAPENYYGFTMPWMDGNLVTPIAKEYVSTLVNNNVVWESYDPTFTNTVVGGTSIVTDAIGGSSYSPIHKVGNKYGTWVGQPNASYANQPTPFFVPFDGTGVWNNANDYYIQLVTSTILNPIGGGGLTLANFDAVNHKGGAAVVLNGSTYEVWFSLPRATFNASNPYAYVSQTWAWVRKDTVIDNLLEIDRIYVNYANNNTRYRWSGSTFTVTNRVLPVKWKIYQGTTSGHVYNEFDTVAKGSINNNADITITSISATTIRIQFTGLGGSLTSKAIIDENDKLILALNGSGNQLYLNLLENRDTRVFSDAASNTVIGTINNTTNDIFGV
jgi:hypothetical protein